MLPASRGVHALGRPVAEARTCEAASSAAAIQFGPIGPSHTPSAGGPVVPFPMDDGAASRPRRTSVPELLTASLMPFSTERGGSLSGAAIVVGFCLSFAATWSELTGADASTPGVDARLAPPEGSAGQGPAEPQGCLANRIRQALARYRARRYAFVESM
jgi:hypothetical protein